MKTAIDVRLPPSRLVHCHRGIVLGAARMLLLAMLSACAVDTDNSINAPDGVLMLNVVDPGLGISGEFRKGDRKIVFEAVVGPTQNPKNNSEWVPYEVDVRFSDDTLKPFIVDFGGHTAINPTWSHHIDTDNLDDFNRNTSFWLVQEAMTALQSTSVDSKLEHAKNRLTSVGQRVAQYATASNDMFPQQLASGVQAYHLRPQAGTVGSGPISCNCEHELDIRTKAAFWVTPYEHSAVWLRVYSITPGKRTMVGSMSTSNHGTSATDGSMSTKCSSKVSRRNNLTGVEYEPCSTSWGFGKDNHFCNDDTVLEFEAFRNGFVSSRATCSDASNRYYAPSCW